MGKCKSCKNTKTQEIRGGKARKNRYTQKYFGGQREGVDWDRTRALCRGQANGVCHRAFATTDTSLLCCSTSPPTTTPTPPASS
eukprot:528498-Karenia_brevis.AAC.1